MKAKVKAAKLPKSERVKPDATLVPAPTTNGSAAANEVKYVLRKQVRPDPDQPRKTFDKDKLQELAESIKAVGIRAPIQVEWVTGLTLKEPDLISKNWSVVQEKPWKVLGNFAKEKEARACLAEHANNGDAYYKILDGERRWRAAELAGVERIPVMIVDTSSPDWEKQKLAVQMVLNQQHENVTALEEAAAYQKEIDDKRHTPESLYKALGISRSSLFSRLALNRIDKRVRDALIAGNINTSVAGLLAIVPANKVADALVAVGATEWEPAMSFRDAQEEIEREYAAQLKEAVFDLKDAKLVPPHIEVFKLPDGVSTTRRVSGGACSDCPARTGNMEGCGLKNPNVCTLPSCFAAKTKAARAAIVESAEEKGKTVLPASKTGNLFNSYGGTTQLKWNTPYVKPNEKCDADKKGRTYKELVGDAVATVHALSEQGTLVPLMDKQAVAKALKTKGVNMQVNTNSSDYAEREKKRKEKRARLKAAAEPVLKELFGLVKAEKDDARFLRAVALNVCNDYEFLKRSEWKSLATLKKEVDKLDAAGLREAIAAAIVGEPVESWGDDYTDEFEGWCKAYGVSVKEGK